MDNNEKRRIIIRSDSDVNWKTQNPILALNEILYVTDKMQFKVGDGQATYTNLAFISGDGKFRGAFVTNSDYVIGDYVQALNGVLYRLIASTTAIATPDLDSSWAAALIGVTGAEKLALVGTVGVPGPYNKFVTNSDPRLSGSNPYRGILPTPPTSQSVVLGEVWEDGVTGIPYLALNNFATTTQPEIGANWGLFSYATQRQLGAPQWVSGKQVIGKLVYDNKLVYRVKQQPVTPSIAPALDPIGYEEVGQSIQVNDLHENKAIRITNDRQRTYYTGIGTAAGANADDGTQKALAEAGSGDFVYITTPLTMPFANLTSALLRIKANVNLNLGGYSVFAIQRQDCLFIVESGTGVIIGDGARLVAEGSFCFFTTATAVGNYRLLDLHFDVIDNPNVNFGGGGAAYIRSGNYLHTGSIKVNARNTKTAIYATNASKYEFIGDLTLLQNGYLVTLQNTASVLVRNGKVGVLSAIGTMGRMFDSSTIEFGQCPIDLSAHPVGGGLQIMNGTTTATVILTDVTVIGGQVVSGPNGSKIVLRGNTLLPNQYGPAYFQSLGMTVVDERAPAIIGQYSLPNASPTVLGGVMVGNGLIISDNGVLSTNITGADVNKAYVDAADSVLQSAINAEKTRMDNLVAGAPQALDTLAEIATQLASDESGVASILATQQQHTQQITQLPTKSYVDNADTILQNQINSGVTKAYVDYADANPDTLKYKVSGHSAISWDYSGDGGSYLGSYVFGEVAGPAIKFHVPWCTWLNDSNVHMMQLTPTGDLVVAGKITAAGFIGDGSQLTNLPAGPAPDVTKLYVDTADTNLQNQFPNKAGINNSNSFTQSQKIMIAGSNTAIIINADSINLKGDDVNNGIVNTILVRDAITFNASGKTAIYGIDGINFSDGTHQGTAATDKVYIDAADTNLQNQINTKAGITDGNTFTKPQAISLSPGYTTTLAGESITIDNGGDGLIYLNPADGFHINAFGNQSIYGADGITFPDATKQITAANNKAGIGDSNSFTQPQLITNLGNGNVLTITTDFISLTTDSAGNFNIVPNNITFNANGASATYGTQGITFSDGTMQNTAASAGIDQGYVDNAIQNVQVNAQRAHDYTEATFVHKTGSLNENITGVKTFSDNIGIGTVTPTQKLEVVGNVKATAFIGDGSQLINLPAPDVNKAYVDTADANLQLQINGKANSYNCVDFVNETTLASGDGTAGFGHSYRLTGGIVQLYDTNPHDPRFKGRINFYSNGSSLPTTLALSVNTTYTIDGSPTLVVQPNEFVLLCVTDAGFSTRMRGLLTAPVGDTFSVLPYTASIALDFSSTNIQTLVATGNLVFTTTNRALLKSKQITITNTTAGDITISYEAWSFLGLAPFVKLAAGKKMKLTIQCLGSNIGDVEAANVLFV